MGPTATIDTAAVLIPERPTLAALRERASGCTACPLYRNATQTVFGEGPATAAVLATAYPSSLLRTRDDREAEIARFVDDLRTVAALRL